MNAHLGLPAKLGPRTAEDGDAFRLRGTAVGRLEGFSDAVFGFALTLIVVSLEPPHTFADLERAMDGLVAFGICFAALAQVWWFHYLFFRRYGLEDRRTIVLNFALLFVVLFYVYPLKFLFSILLLDTGGQAKQLTAAQARSVMYLYGAGVAVVHALLALLYARALHFRDRLGLDELEVFDTRVSIARPLAMTGVALASAAILATGNDAYLSTAGWIYMLCPVLIGALMGWARRRRTAVAQRVRSG